ncbi:MAG: hypothetical protein H7Y36_09570 [Armatimonadetes bacterium]|nr:hypothetical protein [Akkermansiaceae bacterium]
MKFRVLPVLNFIGCLVLTAVVISQWLKERATNEELIGLKSELNAAREISAEETKRALNLERDIAVLKQSIKSTQAAAEESSRTLAETTTRASDLENEITASREQIKAWEAAIAARDEKLKALNLDLTAARKRLDAAVAKLKAAGAR